ncbi:MAG: amidase domain-containing protein [Peptococcaceae bacterium]|nr:amidase domain-containing protein [Peptococcaceae bacterium]
MMRKMKRISAVLVITMLLCGLFAPSAFAYNKQATANYAINWFQSYNSMYNRYEGEGGDCTNFASQALYAGGIPMNTPSVIPQGVSGTSSYWYSKKYIQNVYLFGVLISSTPVWRESSSWIRAAGGTGGGFYEYWSNRYQVVTTTDKNYIRSNSQVGNVIQVQASNRTVRHHSVIVGQKSAVNELFLYYHSPNNARQLDNFDANFGQGKGTNKYTVYRNWN